MNAKTEFNDRKYVNEELKKMFFDLDLIQSFGSGIRRAKAAMKRNHSPNLIFEPDNETDDFTMVTAYISEEYVRIRDEENDGHKGTTQKTTPKTVQKTTQKNRDQIVEIIKENPELCSGREKITI